ncbi:nitroreductase family protein [Ruegeria hyattellae]|uniref:nitroreductase family protein n=1 Tax=Ruegeria hyattellae TaxID=3233337 RepID=UPI00355AEF2E
MNRNQNVLQALKIKFGVDITPTTAPVDLSPLLALADRGSCRSFISDTIPSEVINILCATAMAAPTKSDLQQRDIIVIEDPALRSDLLSVVRHQGWTKDIPHLLIFCGNNRRQRLLHDWHGFEFANDHLDAFFNATADAAIALSAFVAAAEALGFGCCPISAFRDQAATVSDLLALPDHVFPFAGLALGYPMPGSRTNSRRLPLPLTVHTDRYCEDGLRDKVQDYDRRREAEQPYTHQRLSDDYGKTDTYGWSLDKARQYSMSERAGFGGFIRSKGFKF